MLMISRKPHEEIILRLDFDKLADPQDVETLRRILGDDFAIRLMITDINAMKYAVRVGIDAPLCINIVRSELLERNRAN